MFAEFGDRDEADLDVFAVALVSQRGRLRRMRLVIRMRNSSVLVSARFFEWALGGGQRAKISGWLARDELFGAYGLCFLS